MTSEFLERNAEIIKAKGSLPYYLIANHLDVHENTVRNWMKREMVQVKKDMILQAIKEIKQQEVIEGK